MSQVEEQLAGLSPEEKRALLTDLMRQRAEEPKEYPLSFAQQRLWFLDQLVPGSPFYNIPSAIPIAYPLDAAVFKRALNEIVRRHGALRTTFDVQDGEPVQVVAPSLTLDLPVVDLRDLPSSERESEVVRLATEEAQHPFDLSRGPLLRTMLVQKGHADWLLLLTMHHIVSDGWSMGILFQELTALYGAFVTGQPSPLPELQVQYADFAVWQRQWLQGEVLQRQLGYWREQLADLPVLQLPTDRPRPPVQSYEGAHETLQLPPRLTSNLQRMGRQEGATLFMVLLAGFVALLQRYTGQDDIVVGSPIANRTRSELEGLIGFFVNTQVLRIACGGDPTFRDLVRRVREVALAAYEHQDAPFEMLVEELHPERDLSRNPLFQVIFQLLGSSEDGGAAEAAAPAATRGTSMFDLAFTLVESGGGLAGGIEYSTDLFDAATIRRLTGHYHRLLEAAASAPDASLSELPLLTAPEQEELLVRWNATQTPFPRDATVPTLFEEQVARTPKAPALSFEGRTTSYDELNRRANRLAHLLRDEGVGAGDLVGLCLERSPALIVGLLAILKAGGAYLPLDGDYPVDRLRFMVEDAGANLVLTDSRRAEALEGLGVHLMFLDEEAGGSHREENPEPASDAENLVYVMYTSGSTGVPKGIAVPHRAVVRLVTETHYASFAPEETFAQFAPISFDASTFEVWGALLNGARLAIMPAGPLSLAELGRSLQRAQVTTLWLTSGLFNQMIDEAPEGLDGIRQLLTGGDALSAAHVRRALLRLPACRLINGYGPTENTTFTCCFTVTPDALAGGSVPIGRPISNTHVYVVDRHDRLVPVGVAGELLIGGEGLAKGYLNREELTEEKFTADPFDRGGRVYRSGDLVRWRRDGVLEFLGRMDHQVKVRGYRIELGEIEAALARHEDVREAIAAAREDASGEKHLVAYVVPESGADIQPAELQGFLRQTLPAFMVPGLFLIVDELPLGANGKVDRSALDDLDGRRSGVESGFVPAETDLERVLANIWCDMLECEQVGLYDNFFTDLGGHSLLATQLVSQIRSLFQVDLPLRGLFEVPTVAGLTDMLSQTPEQQKKVEAIASVLLSIET